MRRTEGRADADAVLRPDGADADEGGAHGGLDRRIVVPGDENGELVAMEVVRVRKSGG
jgi:hypothetical protein